MSKAHPPELKKFMDKKLSLKLNGGQHVQGILSPQLVGHTFGWVSHATSESSPSLYQSNYLIKNKQFP
ncbi:Small nuclear ribonucleoprotein G [Platysternon megacephalum]|uniref:Small nuclear ribonucleoprotein G n=1 Tax=Platysternon megacephalum TaxID=55544 RepID=A0A4D9EEG7_9SAUR|nr:Small nuclear ribonucleoprotein G [Platysternon megacephalum]